MLTVEGSLPAHPVKLGSTLSAGSTATLALQAASPVWAPFTVTHALQGRTLTWGSRCASPVIRATTAAMELRSARNATRGRLLKTPGRQVVICALKEPTHQLLDQPAAQNVIQVVMLTPSEQYYVANARRGSLQKCPDHRVVIHALKEPTPQLLDQPTVQNALLEHLPVPQERNHVISVLLESIRLLLELHLALTVLLASHPLKDPHPVALVQKDSSLDLLELLVNRARQEPMATVSDSDFATHVQLVPPQLQVPLPLDPAHPVIRVHLQQLIHLPPAVHALPDIILLEMDQNLVILAQQEPMPLQQDQRSAPRVILEALPT